MNLSKNFTLNEFTQSQVAKNNRIANIPSVEQIENLKELCLKLLQPIRDKFGAIIITSGYRCKMLNAKVGGVDNSNHLYGYAADIQLKNGNLKEVYEFVTKNLKYDECLFEHSSSAKWLHLAYRRNKENRQKKNPHYIV